MSFPIVGNRYAQISDEYYRDIPGSPIAYWISSKTRDAFYRKKVLEQLHHPNKDLPLLIMRDFLRLWYEVDVQKIGFGISSCDEAGGEFGKNFPIQ